LHGGCGYGQGMNHRDQSKGQGAQREDPGAISAWASFTLTGAGLGMASMLAATACFAVMNALIRYLGKDGLVPPPEIAFFRALFGFILLLPVLAWYGPQLVKTQRLGMHALRGTVQGVSMVLFFVGLSMIVLAKATAFEFAAPIIATAIAIVFLGESVRIRRLAAMAVGFVGIMIVLRPGFIPLEWGPVFIILSVVIWAGCQLMIRSLSRTEGSFAQTFYMTLFLMPVNLIAAVALGGFEPDWRWVWPDWHATFVLFAIAAVANVGTVLYGEAFRRADMSAVLPLESTKIVWTASLGWAFFAETPDIWTLAGGFVIFAAAAYITIREAQLARRAT
jgi:drug/metabolite transporter (DMT)-like permease